MMQQDANIIIRRLILLLSSLNAAILIIPVTPAMKKLQAMLPNDGRRMSWIQKLFFAVCASTN